MTASRGRKSGWDPLTRAQFDYFADDPQGRDRLRHALVSAQGYDVEFDLRLSRRGSGAARGLGECRIGRTTWVDPCPVRDADEGCAFTRSAVPSRHAGGRGMSLRLVVNPAPMRAVTERVFDGGQLVIGRSATRPTGR